MSQRLTAIAQAAKEQFLQSGKGLSYEYLGPGDAIDNAHNDFKQFDEPARLANTRHS